MRSWLVPRPEDDGVSILAEVLVDTSKKYCRIGAMLGPEMPLRMPAVTYQSLQERLSQHQLVDVSCIVRDVQ